MTTSNKILSEINSHRAYILYMSDSANVPETKSLVELLQDSLIKDYEFAHSLMDDLDEILDLKVNETRLFLYNRDNPNSKSIIKRIQ
jgi:hypothetical protein